VPKTRPDRPRVASEPVGMGAGLAVAFMGMCLGMIALNLGATGSVRVAVMRHGDVRTLTNARRLDQRRTPQRRLLDGPLQFVS
jgi:hypothetical protein